MLIPLVKLAIDTNMLALEAQAVIWARFAQIASGQGTPAETTLMVTEKITAFAEATAALAAGGNAHTVVKGYRKRVRANVRRLGR